MESKNVPQGIINYPIACYMVGIVLIGYLLIVVCAIIFVYLNIFEYLAKASILRTHILCGAFGMLGASVASIRKYYKYLISHSTSIIKNYEVWFQGKRCTLLEVIQEQACNVKKHLFEKTQYHPFHGRW